MNRTPDIELKKLTEAELPLAAALAASINPDDAGESWGSNANAKGGEVWGIFRHEALLCAAWLTVTPGGEAEITAMAVPRNRNRMGFLTFIVDLLRPRLQKSGCVGVTARVEKGGAVLGEALEDAGFTGPDAEDENYPAGEWRLVL